MSSQCDFRASDEAQGHVDQALVPVVTAVLHASTWCYPSGYTMPHGELSRWPTHVLRNRLSCALYVTSPDTVIQSILSTRLTWCPSKGRFIKGKRRRPNYWVYLTVGGSLDCSIPSDLLHVQRRNEEGAWSTTWRSQTNTLVHKPHPTSHSNPNFIGLITTTTPTF